MVIQGIVGCVSSLLGQGTKRRPVEADDDKTSPKTNGKAEVAGPSSKTRKTSETTTNSIVTGIAELFASKLLDLEERLKEADTKVKETEEENKHLKDLISGGSLKCQDKEEGLDQLREACSKILGAIKSTDDKIEKLRFPNDPLTLTLPQNQDQALQTPIPITDNTDNDPPHLPIQQPTTSVATAEASTSTSSLPLIVEDVDAVAEAAPNFEDAVGLEAEISIIRENILFPIANKGIIGNTLQPLRGILLGGPKDLGKLLLARSLVSELVNTMKQPFMFFQLRSPDALAQVKDTTQDASSELKQIFSSAFENKYAVIYLEDIVTILSPDPLTPHTENPTIAVLIENMDKIIPGQIILIGASDTMSKIPSASSLTQDGRFGKTIVFQPPNDKRRKSLLQEYCSDWKNKPTDEILNQVVEKTADFRAEDLRAICKEAHVLAMKGLYTTHQQNHGKDNYLLNKRDVDFLQVLQEHWMAAIKTVSEKSPKEGTSKVASTTAAAEKEVPKPLEEIKDLSFDSIPGFDPEKSFLRENILFPIANAGLSLNETPRGILFGGADSGKLLLAKTLTAELSRTVGKQYQFFQRMKSQIFQKYTTEAETYIKNVFEEATKCGHAVIYLDEIESILNYCTILEKCSSGELKSMIKAMDAIPSGQIIVIGATYYPNLKNFPFPPGLLGNGRFDKSIIFSPPDESGRKAILKQHCDLWKKKPSDEDLDYIVGKTTGLNPEELKHLSTAAYGFAMKRIYASRPEKNNYKLNEKDLESIQIVKEDWTQAIEERAKDMPAKKNGFEPSTTVETDDKTLSFAAVGGLDEQIKDIQQNILFPILNKDQLMGWGVEPIKGIIFHGPPGTGKTLLARTLAAELGRRAGTPFSFFYRKGVDVFNKYVGETESQIRSIFTQAQAKKPAILFFDEVDGLCTKRDEELNSKFRNGVVTTMLGCMDEIKRGDVFVVAATNRLDSLDPALVRPGRFDKSIAFYPPKEAGRKVILQIHSSKWKKGNGEEILEQIAKQTEGYSGADLEQLCRQTFHSALRRHFQFPTADKVEESSFDDFDILSQDWYNALTTVKGSNHNVFGNSITSGKRLPPAIAKLISGICDEILEGITPFLSSSTITPTEEKGGGIKSYLIWDSGKHQNQVIENFIIPSLLSTTAMTETIAFSLDDQHIAKGKDAIKTFMGQILSCQKTAILVIAQLEKLEEKLTQAGVQHVFMEQMDLLRGENVLVLASASCPISELPESVRLIFKGINRSYQVRKLKKSECREFFTSIFKDQFQHILDRVEKATTGGNLYDILGLKDELSIAMEKSASEDAAEREKTLKEIVELYEKNKFEIGGGSKNHMYT